MFTKEISFLRRQFIRDTTILTNYLGKLALENKMELLTFRMQNLDFPLLVYNLSEIKYVIDEAKKNIKAFFHDDMLGKIRDLLSNLVEIYSMVASQIISESYSEKINVLKNVVKLIVDFLRETIKALDVEMGLAYIFNPILMPVSEGFEISLRGRKIPIFTNTENIFQQFLSLEALRVYVNINPVIYPEMTTRDLIEVILRAFLGWTESAPLFPKDITKKIVEQMLKEENSEDINFKVQSTGEEMIEELIKIDRELEKKYKPEIRRLESFVNSLERFIQNDPNWILPEEKDYRLRGLLGLLGNALPLFFSDNEIKIRNACIYLDNLNEIAIKIFLSQKNINAIGRKFPELIEQCKELLPDIGNIQSDLEELHKMRNKLYHEKAIILPFDKERKREILRVEIDLLKMLFDLDLKKLFFFLYEQEK